LIPQRIEVAHSQTEFNGRFQVDKVELTWENGLVNFQAGIGNMGIKK
jgi:hypothetical protein